MFLSCLEPVVDSDTHSALLPRRTVISLSLSWSLCHLLHYHSSKHKKQLQF